MDEYTLPPFFVEELEEFIQEHVSNQGPYTYVTLDTDTTIVGVTVHIEEQPDADWEEDGGYIDETTYVVKVLDRNLLFVYDPQSGNLYL